MNKITVDERRAHQRRSINIDLQGTHGEKGIVARMVARNLSAGGLYCTSSTDFEEMTRLAVRLMLPIKGSRNGDTQTLDVEAVVVRRRELPPSQAGELRYELALFFTGMDDEMRERIQGFLG